MSADERFKTPSPFCDFCASLRPIRPAFTTDYADSAESSLIPGHPNIRDIRDIRGQKFRDRLQWFPWALSRGSRLAPISAD